MKQGIIWVVFLIILLSVIPIYAVKPSQSNPTTLTDELYILNPKNEYVKQNNLFKFHIHVFNTNFTILDNRSVNCTLHLYNSNNSHVLRANMSYDGNNDFEYYITSFNSSGFYSYNVWCIKTGNYGGFLSDSFYVTGTGKEENKLNEIIGIIAIIILFVGILVYYLYITKNLNLQGMYNTNDFGFGMGLKLLVIAGSFWLVLIPFNIIYYIINNFVFNGFSFALIDNLYLFAIIINILFGIYLFFNLFMLSARKLMGK